jgi:hypothetical protein
MEFESESDDEYLQCRMEALEARYRRAQFILNGLLSQHATLADQPSVSRAQLFQSVDRVRRAREQVEDILSTIEFLEDQHHSAIAVHPVAKGVETAGPAD